jgi:hypothetical protein
MDLARRAPREQLPQRLTSDGRPCPHIRTVTVLRQARSQGIGRSRRLRGILPIKLQIFRPAEIHPRTDLPPLMFRARGRAESKIRLELFGCDPPEGAGTVAITLERVA